MMMDPFLVHVLSFLVLMGFSWSLGPSLARVGTRSGGAGTDGWRGTVLI